MLSRIQFPVVFCLVLWANFPLRAQQPLKPFSSDVTYTANGESRAGKMYSDGHSVRLEFQGLVPGRKDIIFVRLDNAVGQALIPLMQAYSEYPYGTASDGQFIRYLADAKAESKRLGSELAEGQICDKVLVTVSYKGNTYSSIEWRSRRLHGFVVKSQDADGQWSTEYRDLRLGAQSTSLFEIPVGYTRIAYSRDWTAVSTQMNFVEEMTDEIAIAKRAGLRVLESRKLSLPEDNPYVGSVTFRDPVTRSPIIDPKGGLEFTGLGLAAPIVLSPADGSVFARPARNIEFRWEPVSGATAYYIRVVILPAAGKETGYAEMDKGLTYIQQSTRETRFALELSGARPGRWQVRPIDADVKLGGSTPWSTFEFSQ